MTVQWEPAAREEPDGYCILLRPLTVGGSPRELWVNDSLSIKLSMLVPGGTYEVGVTAVKNGNRSEANTIVQTLKPERVQIVVPYEENTYSVVLYVRKPAAGVFDGITVVYGRHSKSMALQEGDTKIVIEGLMPGTEYEFAVYSKSRNMTSAAYQVLGVKTCLAPPTNLRAGAVTDTTIEILWNEAEGSRQNYEVICANCAEAVLVQKVTDTRAMFTNLLPGKVFNFSVRTEKESFKDSPQVFCQVRAAPSAVEQLAISKTSTSVMVSWPETVGVVDGFVVSITNATFKQQKSLNDTTERSHWFDGLSPGSSYRITIVSKSGRSMSHPTAVNVTTTPAVPEDVTFVEQDGDSVYVTWKPQGYVDGYRVAYRLLENEKALHEHTVHEHSTRMKDLIPGAEYQLDIQAFKGAEYSEVLSVQITKGPARVCSLSLAHINVSSATVSWEAGVGQFDHYRLTVHNGSVGQVLTLSRESLGHTLSGLLDGCLYNITVDRVRNGVAGASAFLTFRTEPANPKGLRVASVSSNSFSLRWAAPVGCAQQHMVKLSPSQGVVTFHRLEDGEIQANVSSITPGTSYTVMVTAVASSVSSSPVTQIVTTDETPPGSPTNLQAEEVNTTSALLSWGPPTKPNGRIRTYVVQYWEVCPWPDSNFTQIWTETEKPELHLNGLSPGSAYKIKVAAENSAGAGIFSDSLLILTKEALPGEVTNLTASSYNHSYVSVTWFLPWRTNGRITKFSIRANRADTNLTVQSLEMYAENAAAVAIPHCNNTVDPLIDSTPSHLETSLPSTAWDVPISALMDQLRPYTTYNIEVSAFTSEGEGPVSSQAVLTPESAPEGPPVNLSVRNITPRSFSVSWDPPIVTTGPFGYVVELQGPNGLIFNNRTLHVQLACFGLMPYTNYTLAVRAQSAATLGPEAKIIVLTPTDAPGGVIGLSGTAVDSTSVKLSWSRPSQPNGIITQYRILVLNLGTVVQDIILFGQEKDLQEADIGTDGMLRSRPRDVPVRWSELDGGFSSFTASIPEQLYEMSSSPPSYLATSFSFLAETSFANIPGIATEPDEAHISVMASPFTLAPSTTDQSLTFEPEVKVVKTELMDVSASQMSYEVRNLRPFTEYSFRVSAFTSAGEGPSAEILVKTREQVPSSVQRVSYQNISSTSILVSWEPPLSPNGEITHYTVYGLDLGTNKAFQKVTDSTSIVLSELKKHGSYKLRVAASTSVGESPLSEEDDVFAITLEDEPDSPPVNLTAFNITSHSATITWSPPETPNGVIQVYEVVYEYSVMRAAVNSSTPSVMLLDLNPYTLYDVSVRAYTKYGHGNQMSVVLKILTSEDVPGSPPFNLTCDSVGPSEVSISWQPPLQANGIICFYTVDYWNSTHQLSLNTTTTSARLESLHSYTLYSVAVQASTSLGTGSQTSEVLNFTTLEDVPGGPVLNLMILNFSATALLVSWDPPVEPNGRVFYLLSLQEEPESGIAGTIVSNKTTDETVFLFTGLRKYTAYRLSVTATTHVGHSENSTTLLELRTDDDLPGFPPMVNSSWNITSSSIHLSWLPPKEPNGLITGYTVVLKGPSSSTTTSTTNTSLTLADLVPYTAYNVSIAAVNRRGVGPFLVVCLQTDEAEPASPPRNLGILNHTANSLWLSWEPSQEPNGVVLFYGFRIQELLRHTITYQNSSGAVTKTQLAGFRPHSVYQIAVSAFTKRGNGDQYSDPVTFITNETAPDVLGNFSCLGWSWDSVFLEWEAPVHPNGIITHFLLQFGDSEEELSSSTFHHTISGLQPLTEYTFRLRAVNSAGLGAHMSCTARTHPESVPGPPRYVNVTMVQPTTVTVTWAPPEHIPGILQEYRVLVQRLSLTCHDWVFEGCVESEKHFYFHVTGNIQEITLHPLAKYRRYRLRISARTAAGYGNYSQWIYIDTPPGNPDAPPYAVSATASSSSIKVQWKAPMVLSGPTSYLVDITSVSGMHFNLTMVRRHDEAMEVNVTSLMAFTWYSIIVTAFVGDVNDARLNGKSSDPVYIRTLEDEPKDPPKNVSLQVIPEDVTRVYVTFFPPEEHNGNITSYRAQIYKEGQLDFEVPTLWVVENENRTVTAVIEGLKGGRRYSIRIAAVNRLGPGPSTEVQLTTGITAPPKPTRTPVPVVDNTGAVVATATTITVQKPTCFFSDVHGPIEKVQVIVAEAGVMDDSNVTNWKSAFGSKAAPYITDEGFPNPICSDKRNNLPNIYTIGTADDCMDPSKEEALCNGPLKPQTLYVFKFRATNIQGQYTDSEYSDYVKTAGVGQLNRDEQIILGVLLSFFLAVILVIVIYMSVRIHHKRKEGGTYSPREAEIIDTKFKLDQLVTAADLEQKEEKLSQPIPKKAFAQHVEELCANHNSKFLQEFSELPKLLQDLSTSDADLPWNKSKNRFTNIKPYNNNRVKLLSEPGVPGSDYINASFVSGYLCPNEFIATQGPLPSTVADFWRMIWETRTRIIVMLTKCFESGRIRCHQYWPEDDKPISVFGDIIITKLTEDVLPDWTVRVLKVERYNDYMLVNHFNFTSWPDHGVPQCSTGLIQFVKAVRTNRGHNSTTVVVHCSAGVGRTGVFIALDRLIQHANDHDFVDLHGLVAELRAERMCMVQNLAQYMFLHQSMMELLSSKGVSQSIWFVNYSALHRRDSLDAMEGDVELEWEETTM
ncbi:phosphatidylinositol phosphatase PTPRQ-like isoform X2 [Scleropages formosus]|uniref:phosphatidylinositol phosphatase PTPRQ-like isoform X2 n=1 Tax=Scleropages formosus TaxID=113540 RepID=UPI0010FA8244|nr:phosphatidylinositol phosphatase PTPRQ-like isoform X2 [Scleropages formosus]